MSPALADEFSITEPPGKSLNLLFKKKFALHCNPPGNTFSLEEEDWAGQDVAARGVWEEGTPWGEGMSCQDCLKNLG